MNSPNSSFVPTPNEGKSITIETTTGTYARIPLRTRLIQPSDDLFSLLDEYVKPHLKPDDVLFVSEKIVCICQNR
ncbi:MAG: hypothetical protein KGI71_03645, partial [Patescibacteria group bacterium]|nr:hypothetical protein [Patescibacteria group bacterium]